jgi:hypothetical protein
MSGTVNTGESYAPAPAHGKADAGKPKIEK